MLMIPIRLSKTLATSIKGQVCCALSLPGIPLSGWERVDKGNYTLMAKKIPCVTPSMLCYMIVRSICEFINLLHVATGLLYMYPAEGTGKNQGKEHSVHFKGDFSIGHVVVCSDVMMLLACGGYLEVIESAMCECVAG